MTGSRFVQALRSGRRLYGTLTVSDSPRWPSMLSTLGLDFIFIDTEHIPIDRTALSWMCQTYAALGMAPVVRITSHDPFEATAVLDGGARGIVAPYVETVEQAEALRGAVKSRPLKGRRLADHLGGAAAPGELGDYIVHRNAEHALIFNIESVPALENLDALLAVPGLDAVLIGPHDLSSSLGIPEQYHLPEFDRAVTEIITKARAAGVGAGIHVTIGQGLAVEDEVRWIRAGANFILHRADIIAAQMALQEEIRQIREAVGDSAETGEADLNI